MKNIFTFLFFILVFISKGQIIEIVYQGKFTSQIPVEVEEINKKMAVPLEVDFLWKVTSNPNYFLIIVESSHIENNTGARVRSKNDTLFFDLNNKILYDFSVKKSFAYKDYSHSDFKKQGTKFTGAKSSFYENRHLPKNVLPLPILQKISEFGIEEIEGKFLRLKYLYHTKGNFDLDKIYLICQGFERKNETYNFPF